MPKRKQFRVGASYTRREIHQAVGGSVQTYLPTVGGVVVAACLKKKGYNPRAPYQILCGSGRIMAKSGAVLAKSVTPIPVFVKRGKNDWVHHGYFRVANAYKSGAHFNAMLAGSDRLPSEVTLAIRLKRVRVA